MRCAYVCEGGLRGLDYAHSQGQHGCIFAGAEPNAQAPHFRRCPRRFARSYSALDKQSLGGEYGSMNLRHLLTDNAAAARINNVRVIRIVKKTRAQSRFLCTQDGSFVQDSEATSGRRFSLSRLSLPNRLRSSDSNRFRRLGTRSQSASERHPPPLGDPHVLSSSAPATPAAASAE